MKSRDPLHDRIDSQLALRLIANMKGRHEETLERATLDRDIRSLEDEISFAEQRAQVLKERCSLAGSGGSGASHAQVFAELLQETEAELYRLYNARQFLKAEELTNEGRPAQEIAAILESGDPSRIRIS